MMKALSLWQPWASLVATGAKRLETRSWATNYRGPLVIHAAKGGLSKGELIHYLCLWEFQGTLAPLVGKPLDLECKTWPGVVRSDLPFGKLLCIVDLVDCLPTEKLTLGEIGSERHFGDFSLGRYAWKLENVGLLPEPVPMKGARGLFEVPANLIRDTNRGFDVNP
jgi:hypothetical protein